MVRFVDSTPATALDMLDAPLIDGASFSDSSAGVTITQLTHTPEFATVTVALGATPAPSPTPPPPDVQVTVVPTAVTVYRRQSVQFVANQPVRWSLSGAGTISSGGRYTAPNKIRRTTTVLVTATALDGSSKATALITLKTG